MPQLNRHVVARGLQLRNFLISTAACCPSRTILMTGRYTHNNNVTSNIEPHGGTRLDTWYFLLIFTHFLLEPYGTPTFSLTRHVGSGSKRRG